MDGGSNDRHVATDDDDDDDDNAQDFFIAVQVRVLIYAKLRLFVFYSCFDFTMAGYFWTRVVRRSTFGTADGRAQGAHNHCPVSGISFLVCFRGKN